MVMVTTVIRTRSDGAQMEQRNLAKNGLWGPNSNILKITVACVEKIMKEMLVKMMVSADHNIINVHIHRNPNRNLILYTDYIST